MPQIDNAEVVSVLRASRDKLNHGGRHWIKHALKRWVTKDHKPDAGAWSSSRRRTTKHSEQAFCALGAINATVSGPARTAAKIALAEAIDKKEFDYLCAQEHTPFYAAEHIIVRFNDASKTTWPQVRTAFTKAARRLSQRK